MKNVLTLQNLLLIEHNVFKYRLQYWNGRKVLWSYSGLQLVSYICTYLLIAWITIIKYRATLIIKGSNFVLMNIYLSFVLLTFVYACLNLGPISHALCYLTTFMECSTMVDLLSTIICKINQVVIIFRSKSRCGWIHSILNRNSS